MLIRNWLETPGWSTSWMAAAKRAARISRSVNTAWRQGGEVREHRREMEPLRDPISKTKVLISALRRERQVDPYEHE